MTAADLRAARIFLLCFDSDQLLERHSVCRPDGVILPSRKPEDDASCTGEWATDTEVGLKINLILFQQ